MPSDDQHNPSDSARKQLLEEIRKRAEEAEMKRLEEEDRSRTGRRDTDPLKSKSPAPFPAPATESQAAGNKAAIEQKILVLRERLHSALERGKAEKAAELFADLSRLSPDAPGLAELRSRLEILQEERAKARDREQTRVVFTPPPEPPPPVQRNAERPEPPPEPPPPPPPRAQPRSPAEEKAEREKRRRKIADMMEVANNYYQQEKYEKAIGYVGEVLNIDPSHAEALALRAQVVKAQQLEERVREEDEERRAMEKATGGSSRRRAREEPPAPSSGRPTDFWGASLSQKLESDYDLVPEEKGPVGPPPLPLSQRVANRLSQVHIPLKPVLTIAAVAVLALAVWLLVDYIRNSVSPARYSVLILPPVTAGDTSLEYVAAGFEEDLIAEVGRIGDVRVINRATADAFGASTAPAGQIARALGANYVLSWSLARSASGFDLQLTFSDTLTGKKLWGSQFRVSERELPATRPEIVRGLASGMEVKALTATGNPVNAIATNNAAAYDEYLRGRALLRSGDSFAPEDALMLFEQAQQLDPEFADAHAAAAWAHILTYETSIEMQASHISQAISEVQKALSGGSKTSETFRAWGLAEQYRGDFGKAIQRLEQAVGVSPSDAESERRLAVAYAATGRIDDAVKAAQRSVADDPGNIAAHTLLGEVEQFKAIHELDNRDDYRAAQKAYEQGMRLARDKSDYGSGQLVEVLVHLEQIDRVTDILLDRVARIRESYGDFYKLGRVQQSAGKPIAEWQASFVRARDILTAHLAAAPDDAVAQAYLALVCTRLGAFKDALAASSRAQAAAPGDNDVLYLTSRMYALQKDKKHALEYLTKALGRRYSLAAVLDMDFFGLHGDPDFLAALKR